jgi:hypothetical protein
LGHKIKATKYMTSLSAAAAAAAAEVTLHMENFR